MQTQLRKLHESASDPKYKAMSVSSDSRSIERPFAWIQTAIARIAPLVARIPTPARVIAVVALVLLELVVSRASLREVRTVTTFDGGYLPAAFGSVIDIKAADPGQITVESGNLIVGGFARCDISPCTLPIYGDATYSVHGQVGAITLTVSQPFPFAPEGIAGAILLLACCFGILAIWVPSVPAQEVRAINWRPGAIAAGIAIAAALLFPPYLHNDQLGHGVVSDWGYLGWGYVDTISSSLDAAAGPGGPDLAAVPSDGKPILMPAVVGLLGGWISPVGAGYFWSLVLTAITAAGIAALAALLCENDFAGIVAGAIFAVEPMTLGYALSFYQELGFAAAFVWGIFFAVTGLDAGNRHRVLGGAALVALAVCCKSPVLAVESILLVFALLFAFGISARLALIVAAQYGAFALLASVASWPFLWVDTMRRVAFAFGARIIFDQTTHQSVPLLSRVMNAILQTIVHTGPICVTLCVVAIIFLAKEKLWTALAGLLGAIGAGIALVVPTSLYLEHYWFYTVPAVPLLASTAFVAISRRKSLSRPIALAAIGGACVVLELLWALVFWPYPSSATLGCLSLSCSTDRWGVSEPTYGLREAAHWIRDHTPDTAVVGALTAPHVLADQVGRRFVRSIWIAPDVATQRRTILDSGVQYIVGNIWSLRAHNVPTSNVTVAWSGSQRYGSPIVYAVRNPGGSWLWPDAPRWRAIARLVPSAASQIVAFPRRATYLGLVAANRLVIPTQPQATAAPAPAQIMQLNGGVLVTQGAAALASSLDLPSPLAADAAGDGVVALPSMATLEPAGSIALRNVGSPYPGDHRLAAFVTPNPSGYALKYLYVSVHANTTAPTAVVTGSVGLSCAFGRITTAYLTAVGNHDSVAWVPMDAGYVGQCDPTRQRVAIALDVVAAGATNVTAVATPEVDGSVAAALLGGSADTKLLSKISWQQAAAIAARDNLAPNAIVVPAASHEYDGVASNRVEIGAHAALLAFLQNPPGRAVSQRPDVYCESQCQSDPSAGRYYVAPKGRIIWAWSLESLAAGRLIRVDLGNVHPDMTGVFTGVFLSFGNQSCYTDLRDFGRNGFIYLNVDRLRVGKCAGMLHGRLGLALFPRSPISVEGVPQAYFANP